MAVVDHAIDSLKYWFDMEVEELKKEWNSKKYKKLSDCPSYKGAAAYRKALNVLVEGCYLPEYVDEFKIPTLKKMILKGQQG